MANYAYVDIEIISQPVIDESFAIGITYNNVDYSYECVAKITRSTYGQFTAGNGSLSLTQIALNVANAFIADVGASGGLFQADISVLNQINAAFRVEFNDFGTPVPNEFNDLVQPTWLTYTITAEVPPAPEVEIGTITYSEAADLECVNIRRTFTLLNTVVADYPVSITSPVTKTANNSGELFFDYDRQSNPNAVLSITTNQAVTKSVTLASVAQYVINNVNVLENYTGATITVNVTESNVGSNQVDILEFEYSLDGVSWTTSNIFYGILAGSYTAYVRDNFGCEQSSAFTVVGITIDKPAPYFAISKTNSFEYFNEKERLTIDNDTVFANYDNAPVSEQGYTNIDVYGNYFQKVNKADSVKTQIATNYDSITAELIDVCTDEVVLSPTVTEVVTNILLKDKRDCYVKPGLSGKSNIYFLSGNIYEPGTTTIDGTYTITNGRLPDFANTGTIESGVKITLSGGLFGTYDVEAAVYDDEIQGWALQVNGNIVTVSTSAIAESLYNRLDYNIHEFISAFSTVAVGYYKLKITATDADPRYDDVEYISEIIHVKQVHDKVCLVTYTSNNNTQEIDYTTGIVHQLRVPARFVKFGSPPQREEFRTDTGNIIRLKDIISKLVTFETSLIPQYLLYKLLVCNAHDTITINGLSVVLSEEAEFEDLFEQRNGNYKYTAPYQLPDSLTISDETGIVSGDSFVLGTGSGVFVLGVQ